MIERHSIYVIALLNKFISITPLSIAIKFGKNVISKIILVQV